MGYRIAPQGAAPGCAKHIFKDFLRRISHRFTERFSNVSDDYKSLSTKSSVASQIDLASSA